MRTRNKDNTGFDNKTLTSNCNLFKEYYTVYRRADIVKNKLDMARNVQYIKKLYCFSTSCQLVLCWIQICQFWLGQCNEWQTCTVCTNLAISLVAIFFCMSACNSSFLQLRIGQIGVAICSGVTQVPVQGKILALDLVTLLCLGNNHSCTWNLRLKCY